MRRILHLVAMLALIFTAASSVAFSGAVTTTAQVEDPTPTPISSPESNSLSNTASASILASPSSVRGFDPQNFTASFYDLHDLRGFLFSRPYTTPIDFNKECFGESYPYSGCKLIPELSDGNFYSIRWQGNLITPENGTYTFLFANVDDGVRLFIDGNEIADQGWYYPGPDLRLPPRSVSLTAGQHSFIIEYEQRPEFRASLQVRWFGPGFGDEVIPVGGEQRFTPQQKEGFNTWALRLGEAGVVFRTVGSPTGACAFIPPPACVYVSAVANALWAVVSFAGQHARSLANDPSDPNFMVIAQPVTPTLSQQPFTPAEGFTQQEADAANALLINLEQVLGVEGAILTSIDRAQGAHDAGDAFWEDRQLQAAQQYSAQLATLLNAEPELFANLQNAFQASGIQLTFTVNDVSNFLQSVANDGLPPDSIQMFTELGADSATQEQIRQLIVAMDSNEVAALGGGHFPQLLTDSSVATAIQQAAEGFIQFASLKCPLSQGYWKNNPSAWPVTSLTLGNQTYSQAELLTTLMTSSKRDASLILARQLIAAKLNIANGTNPTPIDTTITNADNLLSGFAGKLPYNIKPSLPTGQAMVNDANKLDSYNKAQLSPNCTP